MNKNQILKKLEKIAMTEMSKGQFFHDQAHVKAVYGNVKKLLKHEAGDDLVLLTAALFHDIKRDENDHGLEGAKYTRKILEGVADFPLDKIYDVAQVIQYHDKKGHEMCNKLFSDADIMDAFTSLGIARSFMFYAKQEFSLKDACFDYIKFIEKRHKQLNTKTAKELVKTDYEKCKKFVEDILKVYNVK